MTKIISEVQTFVVSTFLLFCLFLSFADIQVSAQGDFSRNTESRAIACGEDLVDNFSDELRRNPDEAIDKYVNLSSSYLIEDMRSQLEGYDLIDFTFVRQDSSYTKVDEQEAVVKLTGGYEVKTEKGGGSFDKSDDFGVFSEVYFEISYQTDEERPCTITNTNVHEIISRSVADFFGSDSGFLAGLSIFIIGVYIIILVLAFLSFLFWLWMLIDCARRDFRDRALWIVIIALTGVIGALIYLFAVKLASRK